MLVKNSKAVALVLIVFLSIPLTASLMNHFSIRPVLAEPPSDVTIYLDPANITGLNIGDTFDIYAKIKNFTDISVWQVGLLWNSSILECTDVLFGKPFWSESIFKVLAPTRTTLPQPGTIDNINGKLDPPYAEALTGSPGVNGTLGIGYNLTKATFRVKGYAPTGSSIDVWKTDPIYGNVSGWAQYPDVGTILSPIVLNSTVYTVTPILPASPVANFTWTPANPIPYQNITFDASSSLPGYDGNSTRPITEYKWDFNNDGTYDVITPNAVVIHSFIDPTTYPVTLEVYAPGNYPEGVPSNDTITETVTVFPPPLTPTSPTLIFADPPFINATTVGQTINVTIKIQDFIQLWTWQIGVKWNPQILNCTSAIAGPSLADGVFNVLAPGRFTLYIPATINNSEGKIVPPAGESLTYPGEGVTGAAGVSYSLMKLTFEVKAVGLSDIHLLQAGTWYYPDVAEGQTIIRDVYTVQFGEGDFPIQILTNSTGDFFDISGQTFTGPPYNNVTFIINTKSWRSYVNGTTNGFINATIPKSLLWVVSLSEWVATANGNLPILTDYKQNSTHYFLNFVYAHRVDGDPTIWYPNTIVIKGTDSIPEYPSTLLLTILLLGASIAILLTKTRTKRLKQSSHCYSN